MATVNRCLPLWLGSLALAGLPSGTWADTSLSSVADLRYGVALYHYYQQDYPSALSELLVAESRGGIQGHGDNPQLMEAGISLSFGLQDRAESLYQELLAAPRPVAVREAAWFYLGKLHYIRGNWAQAETYLALTGPGLEQPMASERAALLTGLAIRAEQPVAVQGERRQVRAWGEWAPYSLYNLGAAQARQGDFPESLAFYQQLTRQPASDDDARALRDKGYTGMGYIHLLQGDPSAALQAFSQVRRDSPMAHQALLGYGWAALETGEAGRAIAPWQALRQGSLIHPPVQESLLALPYAYEKLGAEAAALAAYEEGEQRLEEALRQIDELRTSLTVKELLAAIDGPDSERLLAREARLSRVQTPENDNWLLLDRTSAIQTRSVYLAERVAENRFQTQAQELRDLLRLQSMLRQWLPRLEGHAQTLIDKQQLRETHARHVREARLLERQTELRQQRDQLLARLETITENRDYMALADDDSRDLYRMVERAQANIERLRAAGAPVTEQQTSVDLYRGILLWQAAQAYPDRLWQSQHLALELDRELAQLDRVSESVNTILATDLDIEPQLARLAQARTQVAWQLAQADQALLVRAEELREQLDQLLAEHQQRLHHYLAQTRLSAARLYDTALRRQQP